MKVGIIQHKAESTALRNKVILAAKISELASAGAELVVLQELHDQLYFCQTESVNNFDLAQSIPGEGTKFYGELAKKHRVVLVTSMFEKRAAGLYHNTAVVFENNGEIAGTYRKMHIPDDPGYYEKFYFTPGDKGFEPIQTSVGKLGVMVCWDQWYPEAARIMALKGAEVLIYPTAIGWDIEDSNEEKQRQLSSWINIQKGHAIANGLPVITVNRVGTEVDPNSQTKGIVFWGNSFILGPQGEPLKVMAHQNEEQQVINVDLSQSEKIRRIWPFFRDRRIDNYQPLLKRFDD
ncbi:MAG: N-carbamoylputrescine amidase [Saprospiraceae bacterium]|jgi:N-carbamoylputrescine amidase